LTFVEIIYGVIFQPAAALKYLSEHRPLNLAILIFSITILFNMLINQGLETLYSSATASLPTGFIGVYWLIGLIISIIILFVLAAIYNLLSDIIYTKVNGRGILTCLAFATVPGILGAPLQYAVTLLNLNLFINFSVLASIWVLGLQILAIKEAFSIQTGQAVLLFVLPVIAFAALIFMLGILVIFLVPGII